MCSSQAGCERFAFCIGTRRKERGRRRSLAANGGSYRPSSLDVTAHRQPPFGCVPRYPFRIPLHTTMPTLPWPPSVLSSTIYALVSCPRPCNTTVLMGTSKKEPSLFVGWLTRTCLDKSTTNSTILTPVIPRCIPAVDIMLYAVDQLRLSTHHHIT